MKSFWGAFGPPLWKYRNELRAAQRLGQKLKIPRQKPWHSTNSALTSGNSLTDLQLFPALCRNYFPKVAKRTCNLVFLLRANKPFSILLFLATCKMQSCLQTGRSVATTQRSSKAILIKNLFRKGGKQDIKTGQGLQAIIWKQPKETIKTTKNHTRQSQKTWPTEASDAWMSFSVVCSLTFSFIHRIQQSAKADWGLLYSYFQVYGLGTVKQCTFSFL